MIDRQRSVFTGTLAILRGLVRPLSRLCLGIVISIGLMMAANAQTASFRTVDTNGDGILSRGELAAAFGQAGAARLLGTHDRNGDNRLSITELRQSADDDRDNRPDRNDDDGGDGDNAGDNDDDDEDGDDDGGGGDSDDDDGDDGDGDDD